MSESGAAEVGAGEVGFGEDGVLGLHHCHSRCSGGHPGKLADRGRTVDQAPEPKQKEQTCNEDHEEEDTKSYECGSPGPPGDLLKATDFVVVE